MKRTRGYAANDYEVIRREIAKIFSENYRCFGYRRMTAALHSRGYPVNHKLVLRLMREDNIRSEPCAARERGEVLETYNEKFGKKGKDLLRRNFEAERFGEKWAIDMTMISSSDVKLYLTILIDLYNTEVVGYSISSAPKLGAVLEAVNYARYKHPQFHPILHSDRGWFFCTERYISLLKDLGYRRSMSESGSCYDNAVAESFFAHLKTELIYPREWNSDKEMIREIHKYIRYFNLSRIKESLNYMSPEQYRLRRT